MEENKVQINGNCCSDTQENHGHSTNNCHTKDMEKMTEKKCTLPERYFEVTPATDIADDENGAELILEIPGANASTVHVEVRDYNILSVCASSVLSRRNIPIVYKREFRLSDAVDVAGIQASTRDGLLTVMLPKSERAKVHHIQVHG